MSGFDIEAQARSYFDQHGPKAMAFAAQKARDLEEQGNADEARQWRRVEARLEQMRGAAES